jgi:aquaporin Z
MSTTITARSAFRQHWPEYLIEAWALGIFMVSAGVVTTALGYRDSTLHELLPDAGVRRALIGVAMGLTAIGLIYSPWGRRSGAHMNPAVTLAFLSLGKIATWDAIFYVLCQIGGGLLGVLAVHAALGGAFADPPVAWVVTVPGERGVAVAFLAEFTISFALLLTVLRVATSRRWSGSTGIVAGLLVAGYITFEAPLSGMSMNPARTLASALPSGIFNSLWVYMTAPTAAMGLAARAFAGIEGGRLAICARLQPHSTLWRCIHCGHSPPTAGAEPFTRSNAKATV